MEVGNKCFNSNSEVIALDTPPPPPPPPVASKHFKDLIMSPVPQSFSYGPRHEKTCLRGFANNTDADQPGHLRSLISAFVILFLESIC